ncbi:MAG: membrane protein insertase YidC, partial [Actinomycetota bacterium]|nr:membrane protein insertase YidC [Actinomycetota bacterium]
MNETNRNMILAIVLSMVVIFGWQFLVAGPQLERAQRQAQIAAEQAAAANPGIATTTTTTTSAAPATGTTPTEAVPAGSVPTSFADRASAIAATSRISIDTPALVGSINLRGARLDDLQLKKYRETIAEDSPIITLLTPSGAPNAYYIEQGWAAASGSSTNVPQPSTVWTVEGNNKLTPTTPVVLAWDNGAGLIFRRTFAIDENYLFTVTQAVQNNTGSDVALFPYSRIVREGTPHVSNFFVQHEGPLGVLGSNNLVSKKYGDMQNDKQIRLDNTSGWLGFGDKYWATAIIADPTQQINAQFTYLKPNNRDEYQTSFVETNPIVVTAGASAADKSYVFA